MTLDQIVHNRVAQMLGDALIRQTTFAAEAEALHQQIAGLQKQSETLEKMVAELTPVSEQPPTQDAPVTGGERRHAGRTR